MPKKQVIQRLAFYLGEINVCHPFREGNGRTQRLFLVQLAKSCGYKLKFSSISQQEMIKASELALQKLDYSLLEKIIEKTSLH